MRGDASFGERPRPFVEAGQLVADDLVDSLIAERLNRPEQPGRFRDRTATRTLAQAVALDACSIRATWA